ncbi:hypothetical protein LB507_003697 [Fusarium sp. FIESC RH6]|nr:hypothetical protein LB507_003697 [Fusarium sp. FIESC RH6]
MGVAKRRLMTVFTLVSQALMRHVLLSRGADPSAGASRAFDEFLSSYFTRGGEQGRVIYEPPSPGGDWELTSERRRDEAKLGCSLGLGTTYPTRPDWTPSDMDAISRGPATGHRPARRIGKKNALVGLLELGLTVENKNSEARRGETNREIEGQEDEKMKVTCFSCQSKLLDQLPNQWSISRDPGPSSPIPGLTVRSTNGDPKTGKSPEIKQAP